MQQYSYNVSKNDNKIKTTIVNGNQRKRWE